MKRALALVLLTALVVLLPRPAASQTPFAWSPAPWSGFETVDRIPGRGDLDRKTAAAVAQGRTGAPDSLTSGNGAPSSPAYSTFGPDRLITPSPKAVYPTLVGYASFYRDPTASDDAIYAALPGYRAGTLVNVVVCGYPDGQARCETAPVWTSCGCAGPPRKIIDLSPALFEAVSGMTSAQRWTYGVVKVTVSVLGGGQ